MSPDEFKAARLAAGLATQEAVAELLEVDRRTVNRWERGAVPVPGAVKVALRCMMRLRELEEAQRLPA